MSRLQMKKNIWELCKTEGQQLIAKGLEFAANGLHERSLASEIVTYQLASNCRYLHRGYYCPSPIRDDIIDNARRGKILIRPSKKSKITHRYAFDAQKRLILAESFISDNQTKREYLVYEDDAVYGFTFDSFGTFVGISKEVYCENMLQSYFCGSCCIDPAGSMDFGITAVNYEKYGYDDVGLRNVDFYFSEFWCDELENPEELNIIIQGGKFCFVRDGEFLVGFYRLDPTKESAEQVSGIAKMKKPKKI